MTRVNEHRQYQRLGHRERAGGEDEVSLRDPVSDDARDQHEHRDRQELQHGHGTESDLRVRELDDENRLGDRLHPRPAERDRLARVEQPVISIPQRAECGFERARWRGRRRDVECARDGLHVAPLEQAREPR